MVKRWDNNGWTVRSVEICFVFLSIQGDLGGLASFLAFVLRTVTYDASSVYDEIFSTKLVQVNPFKLGFITLTMAVVLTFLILHPIVVTRNIKVI